MKRHLVFSNAHQEVWPNGGGYHLLLPPQISSLDSAHDQNVAQRHNGPDFFGVGFVVPAESIAPTR